METLFPLRSTPDGTYLPVRAVPRAGRRGILGERAGALRVAVTEAPEKGKANRAIVAVVAGALGLPRSRIEIHRGHGSTDKVLLVAGATGDEVERSLRRALGETGDGTVAPGGGRGDG